MPKGAIVRYILSILILLLAIPLTAKNNDITNVKVTSVYDGDTFKVMLPCALPVVCDYISVRVRGVDAPEFKTKDSCEKKKAKEQERKDETRRKILIGAMCLQKMKSDDEFNHRVLAYLDKYLTEDRDRKLFNLVPRAERDNLPDFG